MSYKAFYDRKAHTVEGFFTIQDESGKAVFKRVPTRSGQRTHADTDWINGKSPIAKGIYRLWLFSYNKGRQPGDRGIGEFFPISTGENSTLLDGPGNKERIGVGFHSENKLYGTAGCIATVEWSDFVPIAEFLHDLAKQGIKWIPLEVL